MIFVMLSHTSRHTFSVSHQHRDSPFILFMSRSLCVSRSLPQPYIVEICDSLRGNIFLKFIER